MRDDAVEALPVTPSDVQRSPRPESMAETAAAPTADAAAPPTTASSSTAPADKEEAVPRYVVLLAMCAALNSCNLGYDIGVNSGVGPHLQARGEGMHLSDLQLELFFGIFGLAAMLGAAVAYTASDGLGRRKAFACTSLIYLDVSAARLPQYTRGRWPVLNQHLDR